jgi:hypothetical protein
MGALRQVLGLAGKLATGPGTKSNYRNVPRISLFGEAQTHEGPYFSLIYTPLVPERRRWKVVERLEQ